MTLSDASVLTVILNWRTPEMTLRSAKSAIREMVDIRGKIIIVDNDSGDGSFETMSSAIADAAWAQDRITVVQSGHNGGFGAGNNFGILHAGSENYDFIYVLNSDAFPDPDSIVRLRDHMSQNPKVGISGSYIHGEDGAAHLTAFRFPSIWGELEGAARVGAVSRILEKHIVPLPIPPVTTQVDWLSGASIMFRRDMLEQIGLFDETFFLYFEETDLCLRAARAGWQCDYVRASEVTHIGSVSTGMKTWERMPTYWFDSRLYFFRRNHGGLYTFCATLMHVLGVLLCKLRRTIARKPSLDPDGFLWDLIKHYFKTAFTRTPRERSDIPRIKPRKEAIS